MSCVRDVGRCGGQNRPADYEWIDHGLGICACTHTRSRPQGPLSQEFKLIFKITMVMCISSSSLLC